MPISAIVNSIDVGTSAIGTWTAFNISDSGWAHQEPANPNSAWYFATVAGSQFDFLTSADINLVPTDAVFTAVQVKVRSYYTTGGTTLRGKVTFDGAVQGTFVSNGGTPATNTISLGTTNPSTGNPWQQSDLTGTRFGFQLVDGTDGIHEFRLLQYWVLVQYTSSTFSFSPESVQEGTRLTITRGGDGDAGTTHPGTWFAVPSGTFLSGTETGCFVFDLATSTQYTNVVTALQGLELLSDVPALTPGTKTVLVWARVKPTTVSGTFHTITGTLSYLASVSITGSGGVLISGSPSIVSAINKEGEGGVVVSGPDGPEGLSGVCPVPCFNWEGIWDSTTAYLVNDAVSYGGSYYIALVANTNDPPHDGTLAVAGVPGTPGSPGTPGTFGTIGTLSTSWRLFSRSGAGSPLGGGVPDNPTCDFVDAYHAVGGLPPELHRLQWGLDRFDLKPRKEERA